LLSAVEVVRESDTAFESAVEAFVVAVEIKTDCETSLLFAVVRLVEITTLSDTALESAIDAFAVAVETNTDNDAALESEVVWSVEVTTESETAFESATLADNPAETALESAVEGLAAVAVERAVEMSAD
jgi:hypothetical protein